MANIWLSEFTYRRLCKHMGGADKVPPVKYVDENGQVYLDMPDHIVDNIVQNFGPNAESAINFTINHNQRSEKLRAASGPKGAA